MLVNRATGRWHQRALTSGYQVRFIHIPPCVPCFKINHKMKLGNSCRPLFVVRYVKCGILGYVICICMGYLSMLETQYFTENVSRDLSVWQQGCKYIKLPNGYDKAASLLFIQILPCGITHIAVSKGEDSSCKTAWFILRTFSLPMFVIWHEYGTLTWTIQILNMWIYHLTYLKWYITVNSSPP